MVKFLLFLIFFASCSTQREVVQGYSGENLEKALGKIQGKTPQEAVKLLGNPAISGLCKFCKEGALYRIIYLTKDMKRFYLGLSYKTDSEVDCVVLDFRPNNKLKQYLFNKSDYRIEKRCNQMDGAIIRFQDLLDQQELADQSKSK